MAQTPAKSRPRSDRLFALLQILRDGELHTAHTLARAMDVSERTIYRDMDTLIASGAPITGARGIGYRTTGETALPPLSLTAPELEALNLGLAIVLEAADPDLARAAASFADKLDAAMPEQVAQSGDQWKFAAAPHASAARGVQHLSTARSAIRARQKLHLTYCRDDGTRSRRTVRPLHIDYFGRVWTLIAWCEMRRAFRAFRIDLIEAATPLPELFADEPGKTLADYAAHG